MSAKRKKESFVDWSAYDVANSLFEAFQCLQKFKTRSMGGRSRPIIDQIGRMDVLADVDRCQRLVRRIYDDFVRKAFPQMDNPDEGQDLYKGQW